MDDETVVLNKASNMPSFMSQRSGYLKWNRERYEAAIADTDVHMQTATTEKRRSGRQISLND
ncbi:hypothetical protein KIN20_023889 [Parelaphostrongylus tenuis]|uniref:Uncharacterized protein n=1 Tax=Parelaphostrongylus tenuis TaxID=148309 RepID=A0AAD5QW23_PARTN|nr:hypothetical protein KIN20_023889 [Parelaphostrongylus tenuis]